MHLILENCNYVVGKMTWLKKTGYTKSLIDSCFSAGSVPGHHHSPESTVEKIRYKVHAPRRSFRGSCPVIRQENSDHVTLDN